MDHRAKKYFIGQKNRKTKIEIESLSTKTMKYVVLAVKQGEGFFGINLSCGVPASKGTTILPNSVQNSIVVDGNTREDRRADSLVLFHSLIWKHAKSTVTLLL